jgi:hypothetical protein
MALFIAIVVGVIGTLIIERQLNNPNRLEIRIPVRNEETPYIRRR